MPPRFVRHPDNPIITPGRYDWRLATTFNPGAIYEEGKFYLYERAAGGLRPFICHVGMLESDDGAHFRHVSDRPIFSPEDAGTPDQPGSKYGSVQDPRVVKIDGTYYMTFAYRPYAWSSHPTGVGVPDSHETDFPGVERAPFNPTKPGSGNVAGGRPDNMTRSGIATSTDRVTWRFHSWVTASDLDDRDVILFPEKIGGRFAVLRRPLQFVGPQYGTDGPSIWISFSDDLRAWSRPELVAKPAFPWEHNRIGGSTPPLRTAHGWLVLYHGVETADARLKRVIYRVGVMMLDLADPRKVVARAPTFVMEPEAYYEKFGLYIPNVVFPTANVVKDGTLHLYYGACDTAICLATVPMDELVGWVMRFPTFTED